MVAGYTCAHIAKIDGFRRPNFLAVTRVGMSGEGGEDGGRGGRGTGGEPIALSNHVLALQSSTWTAAR